MQRNLVSQQDLKRDREALLLQRQVHGLITRQLDLQVATGRYGPGPVLPSTTRIR